MSNGKTGSRLRMGMSILEKPSIKHFVFTVTTVGASDTFALPLESSGTYSFNVTWGDGNADKITAYDAAAVTHTYDDQGTYTIKITGIITGWRFANSGDRTLIHDIKSWGPLNLGNSSGYFFGCSNLTVSATDVLDLTNTLTFENAFRSTSITTIPSINNWDFSLVTSFKRLLASASSFNQYLGDIDTSSVVDMRETFSNTSINQDFSAWVITSMTIALSMFLNTTLSTANYDALLIGWEGQAQQPNVTFHGGNSTYTGGGAAATARAALVTDGWVITDGGIA